MRTFLMLLGIMIPAIGLSAESLQDLSGAWAFQLDRNDEGVTAEWFKRPLDGQLELPGSLQAQGFGDDVSVSTQWTGDIVDRSYFTSRRYEPYRKPGNIKYPCWLQPDKYYAGAAWYQREIEVPGAWQRQRSILTLERPHWETRVWIDERAVGSNDSLSTPHVYDLGALAPGKHRLTIRVDNRMIVNVGPNSHSVSDHTQGNWNGIAGRLSLVPRAPVWVDDVQVYPNSGSKSARVVVRLESVSGTTGRGTLTVSAKAFNVKPSFEAAAKSVDVEVTPEGTSVEVDYPLGAAVPMWDEFSPALIRLTATLKARTATPPRCRRSTGWWWVLKGLRF